MNLPENILKRFGLSKTQVRIKVLEQMLEHNRALSEAELNQFLASDCNRTTIYRTLKTFEKKKLIFRVSADDGLVRYLLSLPEDERKVNKELHNHLHFHCVRCDRLTCLESTVIAPYLLPAGFTALKNNFVVDGICKHCHD